MMGRQYRFFLGLSDQPAFVRAGRIYRTDRCWEYDNTLAIKPLGFIDWSNRLYPLAKKSLRKIADGYHAGQHALARREKGVVVEGPDVTIGSMDGWNTSWW